MIFILSLVLWKSRVLGILLCTASRLTLNDLAVLTVMVKVRVFRVLWRLGALGLVFE